MNPSEVPDHDKTAQVERIISKMDSRASEIARGILFEIKKEVEELRAAYNSLLRLHTESMKGLTLPPASVTVHGKAPIQHNKIEIPPITIPPFPKQEINFDGAELRAGDDLVGVLDRLMRHLENPPTRIVTVNRDRLGNLELTIRTKGE